MRPQSSRSGVWQYVRIVVGVALVAAVPLTYSLWWQPVSSWVDATLQRGHATDDDTPSETDVHAHDDTLSLEVSPRALLNLGLTDAYLRPVELRDFQRSISVPAVIVPRSGRAQVIVSSPLSGVVTHVHAVTGEAVAPGELLFEVRLTYEDLVDTQTEFLRTISELQVENREIERLEQATELGGISGRTLLERRYAKAKLEALLRAQREALKLHGLSERQVDAIANDGKLLRDLRVVAPDIDEHDHDEELRLSRLPIHPIAMHPEQADAAALHLLVVEQLRVHKGQAIAAGETLCALSDYSQVYIEGKAFEQDLPAIAKTVQQGWKVEAFFPDSNHNAHLTDLTIAYVNNAIDTESRTLSVFVELPNEIVQDTTNREGQRFLLWKYRVGQRLQLRIPIETWKDQIVVPVDAVANEGPDWFVFQQNGSHFDRVPVHLRYRDQTSAVIANDGAIYPGDTIAYRAAHQMLMAIKNKTSGGVDPHAGHSH